MFQSSALPALVLLLPFAAKPAHLDDPLHIWVARQITMHPTDFHGFDVNWTGYPDTKYENREEPDQHLYSTSPKAPPVVIYRPTR